MLSTKRRTTTVAAILVSFVSSLCGGCSRSLEYSVDVINRSGDDIDDATAAYDDKSWRFGFGFIADNSEASYGGFEMPSLPVTATISWKESDGVSYSRSVPLPKTSDTEIRRKTLQFTVEKNKAVTAKIVTDP